MIAIVDYGVGNVGSVLNMLRKVGARARISGVAAEIEAADKVILPGVGHFGQGMRKLRETGLVPVLERVVASSRPTLGICLGMQMMTRGSEESDVPGLGWVPAHTRRLPDLPHRNRPEWRRPLHGCELEWRRAWRDPCCPAAPPCRRPDAWRRRCRWSSPDPAHRNRWRQSAPATDRRSW